MGDTRIQDLTRSRIPPVRHDEFAREFIGRVSHGITGYYDLAAIRQAIAKASFIAPTSAIPCPAMSKAVPCAGVVIGTHRPPAIVTPRSNPRSFKAICP